MGTHIKRCEGKSRFENEWIAGKAIDGWMDDLQFYVLFNSITVISGRWEVDNERLCAMELRLRLRFSFERGSNSVR